ncbi:MAG: hypothetical protein AMS15_02870 [Planctomycetes bacterium DG_23]|nr:MAG: hypothetical protein AMS15_02870 [Planctomycetes bacterium DG_23]
MLDDKTQKALLTSQRNEITEHFIYLKLSQFTKDAHNKEVLKRIANEELDHYHFWKKYTDEEVKPNTFTIWQYFLISKILGLTFGLKLMERGEEKAQVTYDKISGSIPEAADIVEDEDGHENELIDLMDEERLKYVGSIVLGLNDALVELTGALAGLTLALQHTRLVAVTGLITGIAASLSMAASEYLSTRAEADGKSPVKASAYTGSAYVLTVVFLIFPYLLFANIYMALGLTLFNAIVVIFIFTFYVSVARDLPFKTRFGEMALISLGIAALSFGIGFLIRIFFHIEI